MISQFIPDDETECMDPPLQFLSKTGWGIWKTVSRSCNLWHCSQSESVHAVFQLHLNKIHVAERKHNLKSILQGTFPFLDNAYIDFIFITFKILSKWKHIYYWTHSFSTSSWRESTLLFKYLLGERVQNDIHVINIFFSYSNDNGCNVKIWQSKLYESFFQLNKEFKMKVQ